MTTTQALLKKLSRSFKIIIIVPAFSKIKSAFCDEHLFRNRHGHLFDITDIFEKSETASTINSTKNKNTATQGFSKRTHKIISLGPIERRAPKIALFCACRFFFLCAPSFFFFSFEGAFLRALFPPSFFFLR